MLIIAALSLLFTHALLERFFLFLEIKKSPQILLINIVIFLNVTLVFFLTFFFFESPDLIYIFIYSLIFFNCISYSYFHLFNLSETGRRIRFLMDLEAKQVNVYNSEEIILRRINRLSLMGQIKKNRSGEYLIKSDFLLKIGFLLRFFGRLLLDKNRL